jgi:hypothetical protein
MQIIQLPKQIRLQNGMMQSVLVPHSVKPPRTEYFIKLTPGIGRVILMIARGRPHRYVEILIRFKEAVQEIVEVVIGGARPRTRIGDIAVDNKEVRNACADQGQKTVLRSIAFPCIGKNNEPEFPAGSIAMGEERSQMH